jgi:hypothetical protein
VSSDREKYAQFLDKRVVGGTASYTDVMRARAECDALIATKRMPLYALLSTIAARCFSGGLCGRCLPCLPRHAPLARSQKAEGIAHHAHDPRMGPRLGDRLGAALGQLLEDAAAC